MYNMFVFKLRLVIEIIGYYYIGNLTRADHTYYVTKLISLRLDKFDLVEEDPLGLV